MVNNDVPVTQKFVEMEELSVPTVVAELTRAIAALKPKRDEEIKKAMLEQVARQLNDVLSLAADRLGADGVSLYAVVPVEGITLIRRVWFYNAVASERHADHIIKVTKNIQPGLGSFIGFFACPESQRAELVDNHEFYSVTKTDRNTEVVRIEAVVDAPPVLTLASNHASNVKSARPVISMIIARSVSKMSEGRVGLLQFISHGKVLTEWHGDAVKNLADFLFDEVNAIIAKVIEEFGMIGGSLELDSVGRILAALTTPLPGAQPIAGE